VLAALTLLVLLAGGGYLLLRDQGIPSAGPSGRSTAGQGASRSPSAGASATGSPSGTASGRSSGSTAGAGSRSPSPSSGASSSSVTASPRSGATSARPPGTAASGLASSSTTTFLRAYFATAPGGSEAAWQRLGPGEQRQGRAAYNGFWSGIASVDVTEVTPVAGANAVEARLVYREKNGTTSREHKRFQLLRAPSGGWLIDSERPVG
jgi:hypothetical protein